MIHEMSKVSHGHSYLADYYLFHWLWIHLRWWSLLVYGGIVSVGGWLRSLWGDNE